MLTGIVLYTTLNNSTPVAVAFNATGLPWVTTLASIAAVAGIISVMFAFMLACARIWFARVHPRWRTPYRPTAVAGVITALVAGFFPIREVAELVNIGTLSAFIIICALVILLRYRRPELERSFRCPGVPVVPLIGMAFSAWLILSLPPITWMRFVVWLVIGIVLYFTYGIRHSVLTRQKA